MSEVKHTPGPWGIESTAWTHWVGPMRSDGRKVDDVVVYLDHGPDYRPEYNIRAFADARLITAAPELLKALENLANAASATTGFASPMFLGDARSAIAKAKGEKHD